MTGIVIPFRGMTPKVAEDAFVAETATLIGDVEIGPGASVWYGCVLRGDGNRIRVGRHTNIQDGTIVHVNHDPAGDYRETGGGMPTHIGDDVTIGHMALIHACTLEDRSFIGMRSVVMDEAVVERGAMVGAGALVAPGKRVGAGELWVGSPARRARAISDEEREMMAYIAKHYGELAAQYLAGGAAE
jgi:carbonic anhydrase/acetyltransferase-like protein (isoleucine patch superfamily)